MKPIQGYGWALGAPGEPLQRNEFTIDSVAAGEACVQVAGCGLCHTDLSFFAGSVQTRAPLPLILGHEISGTVVAAGAGHADLVGTDVVVPAVMPCGDCDLCQSGRSNICRAQKFPGNDFDGGFATHVVSPARFLCPVPGERGGLALSDFSVIADAVTTPYQALLRSGLRDGDLAVVVGVGGVGTYMVQHARNAGARVVAIDVDAHKLEHARSLGAAFTVDARGKAAGEVKKAVRGLVKEHKLPGDRWKVFETSGTAAGQEAAFALLSFAGALVVVGFTMDTVSLRLSNVMAFDADVLGNWACKPEHYPAVVRDVIAGRVNVRDNIENHPLDTINEVVPLALAHKIEKRVVFIP